MLRHLPNFLTLCNLLCGLAGVRYALAGGGEGLETAAWLLLAGAGLDFADGLAARALKAQSEVGKQLDSLADLVSFGALPGFILWGLAGDAALGWASLAVPVAAALRLAAFNVASDQSAGFRGLPTPANGLAVASLPFLLADMDRVQAGALLSAENLAGLALGLSALMVSRLPLLALKFKTYTFAENWPRYALLAACLVGAGAFGWAAALPLLAFYVALSLVSRFVSQKSEGT